MIDSHSSQKSDIEKKTIATDLSMDAWKLKHNTFSSLAAE